MKDPCSRLVRCWLDGPAELTYVSVYEVDGAVGRIVGPQHIQYVRYRHRGIARGDQEREKQTLLGRPDVNLDAVAPDPRSSHDREANLGHPDAPHFVYGCAQAYRAPTADPIHLVLGRPSQSPRRHRAASYLRETNCRDQSGHPVGMPSW